MPFVGNINRSLSLIPLVVLLFSTICSFFIWHMITNQQNQLLEQRLESELRIIHNSLLNNLSARISSLQRMVWRWEGNGGMRKDLWEKDAYLYMQTPGYQALEWVDASYRVRWVVPFEGNEAVMDLDLTAEPKRAEVLKKARMYRRTQYSGAIDLIQGKKGMLVSFPLYSYEKFDGFLLAVFDLQAFFNTALSDSIIRDYEVSIYEDNTEIYKKSVSGESATTWQQELNFTFQGVRWIINIKPLSSLVEPKVILSRIIFISGTFLPLLLAIATYFMLLSYKESQIATENERRLATILDNAGEGIFGLDLNGCTTFANVAALNTLGYNQQEMLSKSQHDLIHHHYANGLPYKRENCNIYAAFKDGKVHTEDKEVFWHKNGTAIAVEYTSTPIRNEGNEIIGAVVVFRDVTERKRAEKRIKMLNVELEEFAYRTSHDLRSPIVSSLKLLEVAQQSIKDKSTDTALICLSHARSSLQKLEVLIKDILSLTEIKNKEEASQAINISTLISEALKKMEHMDMFERLDIQIDLQFKETLYTKESRLSMIIENLISNAIKYQDSGKACSYIKISTQKVNNHFVLEIEDNGLGIPKNQQDHLFTMFKRFHPKISFGSGLGLYMIKKSADILNGEISFKDLNEGTIFRLTIPV